MRRQRRNNAAVAAARTATVIGVGWWSPPPPPSSELASDGARTGCGAVGPCGEPEPIGEVRSTSPTRWLGDDVVKRYGYSGVPTSGASGVDWYRRVASVVRVTDAVPRGRSIAAGRAVDPAAGAAGPDSGPGTVAAEGADGTGAGEADGGWPSEVPTGTTIDRRAG